MAIALPNGIKPKDVVALLLPDGVALITSFLGVASVAICAVINPGLRNEEIESMLADLEARAVIVDSMFSSRVEEPAKRRGIVLLDAASCTTGPEPVAEPGRESLTFDGVQNRIQRVARAVSDAGIKPKDVVALLLPDGVALITSFLGVASVAICAVINPGLRNEEIESMLADLEARAVIVDSMFSSRVEEPAKRRGIVLLDAASCTTGPEPVAFEGATGRQVARPEGFTETVRPLDEVETASHGMLDVADQVKVPPPEFATLTVCAAGEAPPMV